MKKQRRKQIRTEIMSATVTHLNHEGRGIALINGKTTFLFGALAGETVQFKYSACHNRYDEGIVTEVINASPDRVKPRCQHFGICGGCSLQHMKPELQRTHKQNILLEHFQHQAHVTPQEILPPLFAEDFGYRKRARLSVKFVFKKNAALVGFRERNSSYVADLIQCETLHPSVGYKISALKNLLEQLEIKLKIPQFEVAIGDTITAIIIRHLIELPESDREKLILFAQENNFHFYLQPQGADSVYPLYPVQPENLFYDIPAEKIRLEFLPTQFTQINQAINLQMITRAIELLELKKTDRVLDLFCGIGNFSLPLAKHVAHVVGVEASETAITQAQKNAAQNNIHNTEFFVADLSKDHSQEKWAKSYYDKVLLDPPRVGAKEILSTFSIWQPERIVYISCNPITLARDTGTLLQLGYILEKAGVMDMFPHTEHIEAIALFVRSSHFVRNSFL